MMYLNINLSGTIADLSTRNCGARVQVERLLMELVSLSAMLYINTVKDVRENI